MLTEVKASARPKLKAFARPFPLSVFIREVIDKLKAEYSTPKVDIGFEHGRLHSFRHFFVSQCFLGGASEGEIREWVGHADSKMVEHYRHLGSKEALAKMGANHFCAPGRQRAGSAPGRETALLRYYNPGISDGAGQHVNDHDQTERDEFGCPVSICRHFGDSRLWPRNRSDLSQCLSQ